MLLLLASAFPASDRASVPAPESNAFFFDPAFDAFVWQIRGDADELVLVHPLPWGNGEGLVETTTAVDGYVEHYVDYEPRIDPSRSPAELAWFLSHA